MGTQKIEIGDIFEVPTAIGNAYIQYMAEVDQTTLIRLLPGVYHEPVDLEKLVQQKERYICFVPLGIALRRKYIRKVGFSEVKKFQVPKYFKTVETVCGVFKGWVIVNNHTLERKLVKKPTKKQQKYPPYGIWGIEFLIDRIEKNWNPETWEDEYTEQES